MEGSFLTTRMREVGLIFLQAELKKVGLKAVRLARTFKKVPLYFFYPRKDMRWLTSLILSCSSVLSYIPRLKSMNFGSSIFLTMSKKKLWTPT